MRDIAERVGVHPSTVSRVLNPERRTLVSETVVKQVTETAQFLGYRPNSAAIGLRNNQTKTIGIVISDVTNPTMTAYIRGIEDELLQTGYVSILFSTDWKDDRKHRIVEIMRRRQLDGLILITTERDDPIVTACREDNLPVVFLDRGSGPVDVPSVQLNDRLGIELVIDHLMSLDHSRIALISGPQHYAGAFGHRRHALRQMAEKGIEITPAQTAFAEKYSLEEGERCCEILLRNGSDFTAIFAQNELLALGCFRALQQHGLSCPEDVSIVGYNHRSFTDKVDPPLTTIRFARYDTGKALAQLLLDRVRNDQGQVTRLLVQPTLIVRGSTATVV
jgi:LacI family transcriptional regulator